MRIRILQWLLILFLLPADIMYLFGRNHDKIQKDLEAMEDENPYSSTGIAALNYVLILDKPFRSVFYYRTSYSLVLRNISRLFIPPLKTIEVMGDIGEGFRISHNYAVIHPEKAGINFFVGHGATIGKGHPNKENEEQMYPIIGDNVSIYANAVVFGGIRIGNNVKIGAGAVVNKDVPDNCTVVGNPFRIIER